MALQLSGDIAGLGKIVQIVRATDTTRRTTTSTSFTDAGLSVSITPLSSASSVLLVWSVVVQHANSGEFVQLQISDSSNVAISGAEKGFYGSSGTNGHANQTLIAYDSPATGSAVTYKARFASLTGSTVQLLNDINSTGQLYAIEVAA